MEEEQPTVLVTGSSGLIGAAVVRRLARDYRVVAFDRPGPPYPPPEGECVEVDLTSDESVRAALETTRERHGPALASVVHLAAYYDFSGAPSPKYDALTVRGTERLLRGLREGFQVEQFVFSSTMLVHAPGRPGQRIDEEWPLEPRWPYPESKVRTEALIRDFHDGIPVVVLRIAGVYDDQCHAPLLAHQIRRIYERTLTSRLFPGDVTHGQSFVHLDDVVDAIERVVGRRGRLPGELTLLIGEPDVMSYDELQRAIGRLLHGQEWHTQEIPKPVAKAGAWFEDSLPAGEEPFIRPWMIDLADDHYALDISRARALLGWEPRHTLRETVPRMVQALKDDPLGWYRANRLEPPRWLRRDAPGRRASSESAEPGGLQAINTVTAVFETLDDAEAALRELRGAGVRDCYCVHEDRRVRLEVNARMHEDLVREIIREHGGVELGQPG